MVVVVVVGMVICWRGNWFNSCISMLVDEIGFKFSFSRKGKVEENELSSGF